MTTTNLRVQVHVECHAVQRPTALVLLAVRAFIVTARHSLWCYGPLGLMRREFSSSMQTRWPDVPHTSGYMHDRFPNPKPSSNPDHQLSVAATRQPSLHAHSHLSLGTFPTRFCLALSHILSASHCPSCRRRHRLARARRAPRGPVVAWAPWC